MTTDKLVQGQTYSVCKWNKKCKAEPNSPTLSDDAKQQSRTRTDNKNPQGGKKKAVQHLKFEPKTHVYCCAAMSYKKVRKAALQSAKNEGNKSRELRVVEQCQLLFIIRCYYKCMGVLCRTERDAGKRFVREGWKEMASSCEHVYHNDFICGSWLKTANKYCDDV